MTLHTDITPIERFFITLAVMSATLMQVLDTTIVNVALPHMQGSLSATPDQITWVLTSYLVSSAIFMPLTGYFTDRLGRKNYLLMSMVGFVVASALCGAATSITEIVMFRMLQGVFGAGLVPLSQAILADSYPEEERGKAMAIWGMGVMVGPILGPTLGGYLTEIATWRWTFYINVPFGIMAILVAWQVVPDTVKKARTMDWIGLSAIALAIGSLQYLLDRGNHADWFNSWDIRIAGALVVIGFSSFLISSIYQNHKSVFDLTIFQDQNFVAASIILAMFGLGLFGAMVILPLMLETLFNYPVLITGLTIAPRGISAMLGMMLVSRLIRTHDPRLLIIIGIALCFIGTYAGTYYYLGISLWWIIWPLLFQGFGLGMIFVPLSAVAFSTLPSSKRSEAAGLFSLLRTIGSSIGISIVITIYTRHSEIAWNQMGGFINPYNPEVYEYLRSLKLSLHSPLAPHILAKELLRQAQMNAFLDVYAFIAWSFIVMLPLVFFIQKTNQPLRSEVVAD